MLKEGDAAKEDYSLLLLDVLLTKIEYRVLICLRTTLNMSKQQRWRVRRDAATQFRSRAKDRLHSSVPVRVGLQGSRMSKTRDPDRRKRKMRLLIKPAMLDAVVSFLWNYLF